MPTIPILAIMVRTVNGFTWVALRDATGEVTTVDGYLHTLATSLTQAEWATLKTALQYPEVWFSVEGVNDKR